MHVAENMATRHAVTTDAVMLMPAAACLEAPLLSGSPASCRSVLMRRSISSQHSGTKPAQQQADESRVVKSSCMSTQIFEEAWTTCCIIQT